MKRVVDIVVAIACVVGAVTSYAAHARDAESRVAAVKFAERYTMAVRHPDVAASLQFAPSGDFASDLVADAALRDVAVPVKLSGMSPALRQAWLDAVERYDDQLNDASTLMLDSIAGRPGWPYHEAMLGQLIYARDARAMSPELVTKSARWSVPMYAGATGAPDDRGLWQSLALAYIQTWPDLATRHQSTANEVLKTAFDDSAFVEAAFAPARQILGNDRALQYLPESAGPLWSAFATLSKEGDVPAAWAVHRRWEEAEWRERERDLREIRKRIARGDVDKAQQLCELWGREHDVKAFDTQAGRRQAASLLDVWPNRAPREWGTEPRSTIVKFFLDGRMNSIAPATLARSIALLTAVPAEVRAEIAARAGLQDEAKRVVDGSQNAGGRSWMPYYIAAADSAIRNNDAQLAGHFLGQLRDALKQECSVQVVALDAARLRRDERTADAIAAALRGRNVVSASGDSGRVAVCVGDEPFVIATVHFRGTNTAHILDYGVDDGRESSQLFAAGQQEAMVRVPSSRGSHTFNWQVAAPAP